MALYKNFTAKNDIKTKSPTYSKPPACNAGGFAFDILVVFRRAVICY